MRRNPARQGGAEALARPGARRASAAAATGAAAPGRSAVSAPAPTGPATQRIVREEVSRRVDDRLPRRRRARPARGAARVRRRRHGESGERGGLLGEPHRRVRRRSWLDGDRRARSDASAIVLRACAIAVTPSARRRLPARARLERLRGVRLARAQRRGAAASERRHGAPRAARGSGRADCRPATRPASTSSSVAISIPRPCRMPAAGGVDDADAARGDLIEQAVAEGDEMGQRRHRPAVEVRELLRARAIRDARPHIREPCADTGPRGPVLLERRAAAVRLAAGVGEIRADDGDRAERRRGSRDRAPTPAPSPTRRACRAVMPSDASHGHGWLSPTRNTNVRPAKAGKACGWTLGSATSQVPPAPSRFERCRALRSLGSTATPRCGAMPCASSGRSAVSTATTSARSCRRWRSSMTRSSDGPAATTIAGTPSKAPASASDVAFARDDAEVLDRVQQIRRGERGLGAGVGSGIGDDARTDGGGAPDVVRVLARQHRMDDDQRRRARRSARGATRDRRRDSRARSGRAAGRRGCAARPVALTEERRGARRVRLDHEHADAGRHAPKQILDDGAEAGADHDRERADTAGRRARRRRGVPLPPPAAGGCARRRDRRSRVRSCRTGPSAAVVRCQRPGAADVDRGAERRGQRLEVRGEPGRGGRVGHRGASFSVRACRSRATRGAPRRPRRPRAPGRGRGRGSATARLGGNAIAQQAPRVDDRERRAAREQAAPSRAPTNAGSGVAITTTSAVSATSAALPAIWTPS